MIYTSLFMLIITFILILIYIFLEWGRLSRIYHNNYSFFDLLFIILYPLEGIIFLILYYLEPQLRELWISLIIIFICLTVVIDKWLLRKQNNRAINVNASVFNKTLFEYQEVVKELKKHLKFLEEDKKDLIHYIDVNIKRA